MRVMLYEGRPVTVEAVSKEKFDSLMRDAERVMGHRRCKRGSFLAPPDEGSYAWQWATHLLALEWPDVVTVWVGTYRVVGLGELEEVA